MGILYVALGIIAILAVRHLARRYPLWNINLQGLRYSHTTGTVYTVDHVSQDTLTLSTGRHGWLYAITKESMREAIKLGTCCGGTLRELPKPGESFTLGFIDYQPAGYRHYPLVPSEASSATTAA